MRLRRPPRSPSTASAPSSTAPNRRNRRQRTAVCGAGANARCLGLRDLYRDEVGREGAQGLQAAGLPLRVRGAEEADAVVLVALLDLGDPADELLQARRVHEHQLAEVGHDLAHVVPPRLIVDLVEERPERPVDAQVRVAPQAHDQRAAVHGGCRLEFGVLDAGYLERGHWRPLSANTTIAVHLQRPPGAARRGGNRPRQSAKGSAFCASAVAEDFSFSSPAAASAAAGRVRARRCALDALAFCDREIAFHVAESGAVEGAPPTGVGGGGTAGAVPAGAGAAGAGAFETASTTGAVVGVTGDATLLTAGIAVDGAAGWAAPKPGSSWCRVSMKAPVPTMNSSAPATAYNQVRSRRGGAASTATGAPACMLFALWLRLRP